MADKIFVDGMIFKRPREGAPDFVKGSISVKVADFGAFMVKHDNNGWINMDLKSSKEGKLYLELNTWKKGDKKEEKAQDVELPPIEGEDVPF